MIFHRGLSEGVLGKFDFGDQNPLSNRLHLKIVSMIFVQYNIGRIKRDAPLQLSVIKNIMNHIDQGDV